METTKKLVMTFLTDCDNKVSLTVDNPHPSLEESVIKTAMQTIIEKDIFAPRMEKLVEMVEAKIVVTNKTEYDLA